MISGIGAAGSPLLRAPLQSLEKDAQPFQTTPVDERDDGSSAPVGGDRDQTSSRVNPADETSKPGDPGSGSKANGEPLSEEEAQQVKELKDTDAKVRAHEQAHAAAGGPYASAPSYEFTTGPDGKRYATSGEVEIDSAPERGDPEATIRKMDVVIRAALSPADPSPQDLQVARNAQQERAKAQVELFKKSEAARREKKTGEDAAQASNPASRSGETNALLKEGLAAYDAAAKQQDEVSQALQVASQAQLFSIST